MGCHRRRDRPTPRWPHSENQPEAAVGSTSSAIRAGARRLAHHALPERHIANHLVIHPAPAQRQSRSEQREDRRPMAMLVNAPGHANKSVRILR
jgi:hypothetical protein